MANYCIYCGTGISEFYISGYKRTLCQDCMTNIQPEMRQIRREYTKEERFQNANQPPTNRSTVLV